MFELKKSFMFEAAHRLDHHDGKCQRLHGHSWKLTVVVRSQDLHTDGPKQGMAMDYYDIGAAVRPILESHLDHWYLNETLETDTPTSEYLASWLFYRLAPSLPGLYAVTINETCTSECTFCPSLTP